MELNFEDIVDKFSDVFDFDNVFEYCIWKDDLYNIIDNFLRYNILDVDYEL